MQELKKSFFEKQNVREDKKLKLEERKAKVYEWEKIGDAIDKVYVNLGNVNLRPCDKERLHTELEKLYHRRDALSNVLGFSNEANVNVNDANEDHFNI